MTVSYTHLDVYKRQGYHAWLKRVPSNTEKRREAVKAKIQAVSYTHLIFLEPPFGLQIDTNFFSLCLKLKKSLRKFQPL